MSADDPRRLKPGQSVLVTIAPAPPAEHDPAETEQTTTARPTYTFFKHRDYGLLRYGGPGHDYEAWIDGLWHTIVFNVLNDSYSEITESLAQKFIGHGDLYGPNENAEYERRSKANRGARA